MPLSLETLPYSMWFSAQRRSFQLAHPQQQAVKTGAIAKLGSLATLLLCSC